MTSLYILNLRRPHSYSSILASHTQPKSPTQKRPSISNPTSIQKARKNKSPPQQYELSMSLSTNLSPQVTAASSPRTISAPPKKLRRVASKLFHQKIKLPIMGKKEDTNLAELGSTGIIIMQAASFVTFFIRPTTTTEAPRAQIVDDLKATTIMTRTIIRPPPPQPAPRIYTEDYYYYSTLPPPPPRSQTDLLNGPELRLQKSFQTTPRRSPTTTETGTPSRRNPQLVFVFEATSDRSAEAVLDDAAVDYAGSYERLDDDEGSDVDWSLLDLPEKVYGGLANESRHGLV